MSDAAHNGETRAVRLKGVTKAFGRGSARVEALRGVDLEIGSNEMMCLVGPSGCGKTTLVSIIAGVLPPDDGQVEVFDTDWTSLSDDERTRRRGGMVGFVFQDFNLISTLSALENVSVPLLLAGEDRGASEDRAADLLETMGLGERMDAAPEELSGGMKQRVAIARALAARPRLLVCDEPTANLDGETGQHVMQRICESALNDDDNSGDGRCVIIVTHDTRILHFADRIEEMEDGRIKGELSAHVREEAQRYKEQAAE